MTDVPDAIARGHVCFMGIEMLVAPRALVPRPETELLGWTAVHMLSATAPHTIADREAQKVTVIDMCCGSGNLACAIAYHVARSRVWACDITDSCVDLARRNVVSLALTDRVDVRQGDLFHALANLALESSVDMIVCNPPYISDKQLERGRADLLEHEPREAFAAGPYGLSIYMRVIKDAPAFLRSGGALVFEIGLGQHEAVKRLFERTQAYHDLRLVQNDTGEVRVVAAIRR